MARIRSVKPEFFTSLSIGDLTERARLTFIGLWTYADDHGRAIDDPRLIKAAVFPLDEHITTSDVDAVLGELSTAGRIHRYDACGRRYLVVTNWSEHQRVEKARPSRYPDPPSPGPSDSSPGIPGGSPNDPGGVPDVAGNDRGAIPDGSRPEQGAGSREQVSLSPPGDDGKTPPRHIPDGERETPVDRKLIERALGLLADRDAAAAPNVQSPRGFRQTCLATRRSDCTDGLVELQHQHPAWTSEQLADAVDHAQDAAPTDPLASIRSAGQRYARAEDDVAEAFAETLAPEQAEAFWTARAEALA